MVSSTFSIREISIGLIARKLRNVYTLQWFLTLPIGGLTKYQLAKFFTLRLTLPLNLIINDVLNQCNWNSMFFIFVNFSILLSKRFFDELIRFLQK